MCASKGLKTQYQIFCFGVWPTPAFTISASPASIVCLSSSPPWLPLSPFQTFSQAAPFTPLSSQCRPVCSLFWPSPPFSALLLHLSSFLFFFESFVLFFKKACLVAGTTVQETIFFSGEISTRSKTSHFLSLSHIGRCEKARPPPGASRLLGSSWRRLVQPPRGESHSLAHTHRDTPPPQGDAHGPAGGLPQPALLDVPDCHSTFYHPTSLLCELPTDDRGSSENVQIWMSLGMRVPFFTR